MINRRENELKKYFSKELKWGWTRNYQAKCVFNFLLNAARFSEKGVILDAGAGNKRYSSFFGESLYLSQEHKDGIKFKNMHNVKYDFISPVDVKIPLKNNCIDSVLSTSVIEHIKDPANFFCEALRVIKPGGKLFINVPFTIYEHEIPYDYNRPTRYRLKAWLKEAGFFKIEISASSSCTEAITNMLPSAIYIDTMLTGDRYEKVIKEFVRKKEPIADKIKFIIRFIKMSFTYYLVSVFCCLLKWFIDRGPHEGARIPAGWVAIATKRGSFVKNKNTPSKKDFLLKYYEK